MPAPPWTTPEQDKFLHGFDNEFLREQEEGTLEDWFPTVYDKFFERWEEENPEELVEVTVKGKTVLKPRLQVKKEKIYHWFYNHCKPVAAGKVLNLGKKPRVLQGYQAYQRVFRKTLKPQFNNEYEKYWRALKPEDKKLEKFVWRNQRAMELFKNETKERKDEVAAYRRSHRFRSDSDSDSNDSDDPKAAKDKAKAKDKKISRALGRLTHTLDVAMQNIEFQTGWVAGIFVGGWDPKKGKISTFSVHNGATKAANLQWYQQDGFHVVDESWKSFVDKVFPDRKATAAAREHAHDHRVQTTYDADVEDLHDDGADHEAPPKQKTIDDVRSKGKERAKDMANSQGRHLVSKPTNKGKERAREKEPILRSSLESDPEPSHSSSSDTDPMDIDTVAAKPDNDAEKSDADKSDTTLSPSTSDDDDETAKPINGNLSDKEQATLTQLGQILNAAIVGVDESKHREVMYAAFDKFTRRVSKKTHDFELSRKLNMAMNKFFFNHIGLGDVTIGGSQNTAKGKKPAKGTKPLPRPRPKPKPGQPSSSSSKPASRRAASTTTPSAPLRRGRSASRNTSGAVQPPRSPSPSSPSDDSELEEVGVSTKQPNDKTDKSHAHEELPVAKWMLEPLKFFDGCSGAGVKSLVRAWMDFERFQSSSKNSTANARLPKQGRPGELTTWIGQRRPLDRPPKWESKAQLKGYGGLLKAWWENLQPGWRESENGWPMKRERKDDDSWGTLRCGGANGVFLVVIGLVWWSNALKGKPTKELATLLEDVEWAITEMARPADTNKTILGKRPRPVTHKDKRGKKKARTE